MKQLNLLRTWLLLLCLALSTGVMWGEEATLSISSGFTSNGNLNDSQTNSWAISSDGSYTSSNSYIQVGTNSKSVSYLKLSTSAYSAKNISKIQVWATSKANSNVTTKIYIGGNKLGESSAFTTQNASSGGTEFSVNNTNEYQGEILVEISRPSSSTGAIYFNKLVVTYSDGGSTPEDTRTAVNMTEFSATSTTLIKGNSTNTSVTNNQPDWTASYSYESSNSDVATVSNDGVVTAVAKGTAKITASLNIANDDATWKKGETSSMSVDITVINPSYNYTFYSNGTEVSSGSCEEGEAITFPANKPKVDGVEFIGWAENPIVGNQDNAPSLVTSKNMGNADANFYAVFATAEGENTTLKYGWEEAMSSIIWEKSGLSDGTSYSTYKHDGNYAASTGSSTTAYIKTKNKIASPKNAVCYYTKASTNTNSSSKFIIQVSSDGKSWIDVQSGKTMNNVTQGTFEELTADLSIYNDVYVRFYYSGTSATRVIDDVSVSSSNITYTDYCTTVSLDPKPTIVLSATELAEYVGNTNTTITASVSEETYIGTLTVESSAENVATASISEGTITIKALAAGSATITVTAPEVTGFRKNTATIAVTVSEKLAHGLSFSADALNLTVGDTEFTEPTLSNPNSLPVVYSLVYAKPENEGKVAIIDSETGKITLMGLSTETQGAVTVKASTVGDNSHAAGETTYNLVVARKTTTTSWSNGGVAVTIDKDEIDKLPTASNDGGRNIAYESSNTDVATIDNTGAVTFVAYGKTTITAKTSATSDYAATSVSYELTFAPRYTVTFSINGVESEPVREETSGAGVKVPEVAPVFNKELVGWSVEYIALTDDKPEMVILDNDTYKPTADVTLYAVYAGQVGEGETLYELSNEEIKNAYEFNVTNSYSDRQIGEWKGRFLINYGENDGGYFVQINKNTNNYYISSPSFEEVISKVTINTTGGTASTRTQSGRKFYLCANDETTQPSDGIYGQGQLSEDNGSVTIEANGSPKQFYLYSDGTAKIASIVVTCGSVSYSGYCTTVTSIIPLNAACHTGVNEQDVEYNVYGTFSCSSAFIVPEDITVEEVGVSADGKLNVKAYETGDIVPANTGVMVHAATGGDYTIVLTNKEGKSVLGDDNRLRPSGDEGIKVAEMEEKDPNCVYYRLTMHKGEKIGFWWGAADGAAFDLAKNKAYLAVPKGSNAKVNGVWVEAETNGISSVNEEVDSNETYYNIAGQRVNASHKGIVIVNGRKFINK